MFGKKKISKNVLDFFAKSVRDAASEEEVNEIVETTNDVLNEETQKDAEPMVTENEDDLKAIMSEVLACLKRIEDKGATDSKPVVEDEDPAMKKLNELEDACSEDKTTDANPDEDIKDEERPIEEVVESSRVNTTDGETSESEGLVPTEGATFEKIVKDMKPILARISDVNERKLVCDSLAKSLGQAMKKTSAYGNILDATIKNVKDSKAKTIKDEDVQKMYDEMNPHKQTNK